MVAGDRLSRRRRSSVFAKASISVKKAGSLPSACASNGCRVEAPALQLAERIVSLATDNSIATALIGANALAVHNFVRATLDVDLATNVNPFIELRRFEEVLRALGLQTELRLPDEDDPLGGVLEIWNTADEDGTPIRPVELVNFDNPRRPGQNPGARAIANAVTLVEGGSIRCVTLPDLVALKLYAGGRSDHADIAELLRSNPGTNLTAIRIAASPYDGDGVLEALILEAAGTR